MHASQSHESRHRIAGFSLPQPQRSTWSVALLRTIHCSILMARDAICNTERWFEVCGKTIEYGPLTEWSEAMMHWRTRGRRIQMLYVDEG